MVKTLFEDDFENDFIPWYGYTELGGNTIIDSTLHAHHGVRSAKCVWNTGTGSAIVLQNFTPSPIVCSQFEVYFTSLPANGEAMYFFEDEYDYGYEVTRLALWNNGGIYTWRMAYLNPTTQIANYAPATPITTGKWYDIVVFTKIGAGNGFSKIYFDSTLGLSQTNLTNNSRGSTMSFFVAGVHPPTGAPSAPVTFHLDCFKITDDYVVSEVAEQTTTNVPIVYPTVKIEEGLQLPSVCSAVVGNYGSRLRTMKHTTPISPWTAK